MSGILYESAKYDEKLDKSVTLYVYYTAQNSGDPTRLSDGIKNSRTIASIYKNFIQKHSGALMNNVKVSFYNIYEIDHSDKIFGDDDYLLSLDILYECDVNKIIELSKKFKRQNMYLFTFECILHAGHIWKISIFKYFGKVFTNLDYLVDNKKYFWVPAYHQLFFHEHKWNTFSGGMLMDSIPYEEKLFMANNPISSGHNNARIDLITQFSKKSNIDLYGGEFLKKYTNNYKGVIQSEHQSTFSRSHAKSNVMKKYKYSLVIENLFTNGYITEKFVDSLCWLNVPIYFGPKDIDKLFPELFDRCMINGHNFKSVDDILIYVSNIDQTEYYERINKIKMEREKIYEMCGYFNIMSYMMYKSVTSLNFNNLYNSLDRQNQRLFEMKKNTKIMVTSTAPEENVYNIIKFLRSQYYTVCGLYFVKNSCNIDTDNIGGIFCVNVDNINERSQIISQITTYLRGRPDAVLSKNDLSPNFSKQLFNTKTIFIMPSVTDLMKKYNVNTVDELFKSKYIENIHTEPDFLSSDVIVPKNNSDKELLIRNIPKIANKIKYSMDTTLCDECQDCNAHNYDELKVYMDIILNN